MLSWRYMMIFVDCCNWCMKLFGVLLVLYIYCRYDIVFYFNFVFCLFCFLRVIVIFCLGYVLFFQFLVKNLLLVKFLFVFIMSSFCFYLRYVLYFRECLFSFLIFNILLVNFFIDCYLFLCNIVRRVQFYIKVILFG